MLILSTLIDPMPSSCHIIIYYLREGLSHDLGMTTFLARIPYKLVRQQDCFNTISNSHWRIMSE